MATKSISQLDTQATANETDLFEVAIVDANSASGYASKKESAAAIADAIVGEYQYPLRITGTTAKTIAGAINELKNLVDLLPQFSIEVVQTLPVSDISETTIYLVPASDPEQGNYYEEYIYVNNAWELVGTTAVDLSGYYTSAQTDTLLAAKANSADLATVATSGAYSDLSGKPTIDTQLDTTSTNAVENRAVASAINEIADEISSSNTSDNEPYLLRDSESGTADRMVDELVGGTVAWNQIAVIMSNDKSATRNGVTLVDNRDGSYTFYTDAGGATATAKFQIQQTPNVIKKNHKYIMIGFCSKTDEYRCIDEYNGILGYPMNGATETMHEVVRDGSMYDLRLAVFAGAIITTPITFKPNVLDLTQMFGSTIADYIYSLEQATAGAGVAFFRKLFPEDYYAYNAGELMSVKATAHKMRDASDNIIGNYPLDANLELRGLFKLDANNKLYCDGDIYESSGKVTRKYGIVDLGSFNWQDETDVQSGQFKVRYDIAKYQGYGICIKYALQRMATYNSLNDKEFSFTNSQNNVIFRIRDTAYNDATAFKTAMNGVYLVYELATPTTETAASFAGIQVVDGDGTEEYVDSRAVPIPVGHNTTYIHGLNEYRAAVESYLASLDARITALENASSNRSISVSNNLTKSLTSDFDANEGILEDTKETEEETKEEAQNER